MALWVQKYGGTSVASHEHLRKVAARIADCVQQGHQMVVVLSAMAGQTDALIEQAQQLVDQPNPEAFDALLSTGEQVSCALLAMLLQAQGLNGVVFNAFQCGIQTQGEHGQAKIQTLSEPVLRQALDQGIVPIVTGFQGVNADGRLTTLGRGGSDLTAVALAAVLGADECQIFSDVEGVYTADPAIEAHARLIEHIDYEAMLELSSMGSQILQNKAVEYAAKFEVPLRVASSFHASTGTLISGDLSSELASVPISGVAKDANQVLVKLNDLPAKGSTVHSVLDAMHQASIAVDMLVQHETSEQGGKLAFTVASSALPQAETLLQALLTTWGQGSLSQEQELAKISLVGLGVQSNPEVSATLFKLLSAENIPVYLMSSSDTKLSVLVHEKYQELAVRALHHGFSLDNKTGNR